MFEWLFGKRCMTLVGSDGVALRGAALERAERALQEVCRRGDVKVWPDKDGLFWWKERSLFSSVNPVQDSSGVQLRICGNHVGSKESFCSSCGNHAPGVQVRCGHCGSLMDRDVKACPSCGKSQHFAKRLDLPAGNWHRDAAVFAERFEWSDVGDALRECGLNVQESQHLVLLDGGAVVSVLSSGHYGTAILTGNEGKHRSLVLIDGSELRIPICVCRCVTKDQVAVEAHVTAVVRFEGSREAGTLFMSRIMGQGFGVGTGVSCSCLSEDEVGRHVLPEVDSLVRKSISGYGIESLYGDAASRLNLEDSLTGQMADVFASCGFTMVRLMAVELVSPMFEELSKAHGELESRRRELEFKRRMEELSSDSARSHALSEHELREYMLQLAHERGVSAELREQEMERVRREWCQSKEREELEHQLSLEDIRDRSEAERRLRALELAAQEETLRYQTVLERQVAEQNNVLERVRLSEEIEEIKRRIASADVLAKQEETLGWIQVRQQKMELEQAEKDREAARKVELVSGLRDADLNALLVAEDDPEKRQALLERERMHVQASMSPQMLLAVAAARGNSVAASALASMNEEQRACLEAEKAEHREIYDRMLAMNESMFRQAMESMSRRNDSASGNTTQIFK